ncbi:hypothetical protein HYV89_00185 [Candidatus Woesearchaeota archaeon]|nr:hypothetical protein [Candidatus Woesearchaeota archaeon]
MKQETIENKVNEKENNMTFGSVYKSMIPSVIVGTVASMGSQELASEYTSNPEALTTAGLIGQYIGGYGTYFASYLCINRDRLIENGRVKWGDYGKEISSVMVSDRVGNKVWAGTYGLSSELAIRSNASPMLTGAIAGITSGIVYSAFTGVVAPRVNSLMSKTKNVFNKIKNLRGKRICHQVDLVKKQSMDC